MTKNKGLKKGIAFLTTFIILLVLGITFAFVSLDKGQLGVVDYKAYPKAIKLGLDLKGGVYAVYTADRQPDVKEEEFKKRLDGTVENFEQLLFSKGYTEAKVTKNIVSNNSAEIRVEVPNVQEPKKVFDLIGKPAIVLFKKTNDTNFDKNSSDVVVSGEDVKSAGVSLDENGKYQISLEFNSEGADKFAKATAELQSTKSPIHIFINNKLLMSPTVQTTITGGKASITGQYTYEQANELAIKIQAGALPLKLTLSETDTISPTLGVGALKNGLIAGGVGLGLIIILLIALYGLSGVAASLALLYYALTYLFVLSVFPWAQLTLPGIAGVLLSLGMAVDANIIIFERIKEEYRSSDGLKSLQVCVKNGFRRSASAIIDGNVTTIIGAIILTIFAVASIKGFAITLLIGIALSLFSSLLVTRWVLMSFLSIKSDNAKAYGLNIRQHKYYVTNSDGSIVMENPSSQVQSYYEREDSTEEKEVIDNNKVKDVEVNESNTSNKKSKDINKSVNAKTKYKKMKRKNLPKERKYESKYSPIIKKQEVAEDNITEEDNTNE